MNGSADDAILGFARSSILEGEIRWTTKQTRS